MTTEEIWKDFSHWIVAGMGLSVGLTIAILFQAGLRKVL